ncbi:relaxase/mobilization nuclease domain-containing protein [Helicobacter pylori]|uniref:relaxase/mobilization nuclease domain-containing protein n=1 Tax=Helicobacter pylori TaxID=210 RepID=UPI0018D1DB46|nr:relaxase/mobilization nuclease domain-containing protein [Helicobacter pylori]MBH0277069.1 relaxase/mobilization nuclease domain-containing protein [Helicobacter pylori]
MLDRVIRDPKSDSRPLDLSFLDDILEHMRKPRPSDSDKVDKRLLIKFNQFSSSPKSIKSNLVGTKSISPVLIKNIGQMKRSHLENALSYALENSETAYNEMFVECNKQFILETWLNDFDLTNDYNEAMHLVFSIKDKPDGKIMQGLLYSTWESLKVRLPEYKFALVPHTHQDHAHIHCFINKTNQLTRRRLRFKGHEDCKEFFNELRSEFAYRLNNHLLSEEYLYVNEPKLKELDNIKQQLQDLEKEEKALEQIKTPQDEWDLNKALQKEYLQTLKDKNKAKALDIQNNQSAPLKQKISAFKIALFNHKDTSDDEKEQLDIDRIDKRKPVSEHLKNTNKHELYELLGFYQKELDKKQKHCAFKNFHILNDLDKNFERETKGYSVLKKKEMLLNKLERLDKRLLDKNSHLLLAQLRNEVKTKQNTQYSTLTNPILLAKALELSKDKRPTLKTFKNAYFSARKYQFMLESFKTKQNDPTYKLNDNTYELVSKQLQDYQNTMLLLAKERLLFLEQDLKQKEEEFKRAKESYFKALESYKEAFSLPLKEKQDFLKQTKQFSKLSKDIVYICNEIIGANRFLTHYDNLNLEKVLEHAKDTKLEQKQIQAITKEPNNDEPWIEHGKRMQEKAKAHYQACLEKEKAKELAKQQANTLHSNELDDDPKAHAGLKENDSNTNSKGRNR